jgi:hypothetical protein
MKAGQTNIEVNSIVAITGIKDKNDSCMNGVIGEATHPFATGCTDKGWIGIRTNTMTPFGFQVNCEAKEVKPLNEKELQEYFKCIELYGESNVYFDANAKENRLLKKDNREYTKEYGIVLSPIN